MSLNFSISSSDAPFVRRRRSLRGLVTVFAVTGLLAIGVSWLVYQRRGLERHEQDIQLHEIASLRGPIERLVLSDSVTENATRGVAFAPGNVALLTHGWMRLAGNVLMLQRVLERGPVKAVDLFLEPDMFVIDIDDEAQGRIRHTYTDTLFTGRDEIAELRNGGDTQAGKRFVFFELIYKALQPGKRRLPPRDTLFDAASRPITGEVSEGARAYLTARNRVLTPPRITQQNAYFLMRFSEVCRERAIPCRLILEPLPPTLPRLPIEALREKAPGIEVIDVNALETFPDGAFHDGLHLAPDWAAYYRTLLARHGLMQFATSLPADLLPPWDGTTAALSDPDSHLRLQNIHGAEPWGRWTQGTSAYVSFRLGKPGNGRSISLAVTGLVRKGPQVISLSIAGTPVCQHTLIQSGETTITCPWPAGIEGPIALRIETSYASSPREWGEADDRQLGIGLRHLSVSPAR